MQESAGRSATAVGLIMLPLSVVSSGSPASPTRRRCTSRRRRSRSPPRPDCFADAGFHHLAWVVGALGLGSLLLTALDRRIPRTTVHAE
jgi:hypothetical protein